MQYKHNLTMYPPDISIRKVHNLLPICFSNPADGSIWNPFTASKAKIANVTFAYKFAPVNPLVCTFSRTFQRLKTNTTFIWLTNYTHQAARSITRALGSVHFLMELLRCSVFTLGIKPRLLSNLAIAKLEWNRFRQTGEVKWDRSWFLLMWQGKQNGCFNQRLF